MKRFLLMASLALGAAANAGVPANRPNILLVLSDDHSAPHAGCYGNPDVRTPNLDGFAAQGMRFDRAYVTSPQCVALSEWMILQRDFLPIPVLARKRLFSAPSASLREESPDPGLVLKAMPLEKENSK